MQDALKSKDPPLISHPIQDSGRVTTFLVRIFKGIGKDELDAVLGIALFYRHREFPAALPFYVKARNYIKAVSGKGVRS